jgi:hypothetical protein
MSNRDAMIAELVELVKKMNIPQHRKKVCQREDLRWLKRCLPERNSEHKDFPRAMEILKEVV